MIPMMAGLMAQYVAPAGPQTLLSTTNIAANNILGGGDSWVEATAALAGIGALSDAGKTTGKYYAEIKALNLGSLPGFSAGLHRGTAGLTSYLGSDTDGWGAWADGAGVSDRSTFHNATRANVTTIGGPSVGAIIRIAVDIDAGQLWLARPEIPGWTGGGDPASGTSPTYSWTPDGATYYLCLNPRNGSATVSNRNRLGLVLPSDWNYSAPSGFGIWSP